MPWPGGRCGVDRCRAPRHGRGPGGEWPPQLHHYARPGDEEHLGAFLQMMEFQTAFMGELLDINAFDQEGVELGKRFTYGLMAVQASRNTAARFTAYEKKRKAL